MKNFKTTILIISLIFGIGQALQAQDHDAVVAMQQQDDMYYTSVNVETDFETTITNVKAALKAQGFGVVSEINMQEKLKSGADKNIPKYTILGACNPEGAYRALQIEENIGVMLPCNVIVRETGEGKIEVAAINPIKSMQSIGNPEMTPLAKEISDKLKMALNSL